MNTEVEVVVLRHQLRVLKRQARRPRLRRRDRLVMAAISGILPRARWWSLFVVSPPTRRRWHRGLVQRKWTYQRVCGGGRPPLAGEVGRLIVRMGRENPRWGCVRIRGELAKLGIRVSAWKVRTLLRRSGLGPAPRPAGPSWGQVLRSQARGIRAVDFVTVQAAWLRALDVLFAIELRSGRGHVLGVTANPDSAWVTRQARNLAVGQRLDGIRFVIRDRDANCCGPFEVFRGEGVRLITTPIRARRANAVAKRWARTVRTACRDRMLVLGRRHLEQVPGTHTAFSNGRRPHRGLEPKRPDPRPDPPARPAGGARVRPGNVRGGLIHEYDLAA